jgi:hypothetical protein
MENTIPQELIDKALALTGKTTSYVEEDVLDEFLDYTPTFSYPKFYAYLLSPEFIEKYNSKYCDNINCDRFYTAGCF